MAYNYNKDEQTQIAIFDKNDKGDKIQIQHIKNKNTGAESVDIRLMYTKEGEDDVRPTQKGVRFSTEMLPDIVTALASMLTEDEKQELCNHLAEDMSDEGE